MIKRLAIGGLVLSIVLASVAPIVAKGPANPSSNAFGKSLSEWMLLYYTWSYGGDQEGSVKKVVFLPVPEGVPVDEECPFILEGELDFELNPGEKFVLPMFAYVGEYYEDGSVDDPDEFPPAEIFTSADVLILLDGEPIIDSKVDDMEDFFFDAQYFDPPIFYDVPTEIDAVAAAWVKGIGFTHMPLPKGDHTLELYVDTLIEIDPVNLPGCTLVFQNRWNLTVD